MRRILIVTGDAGESYEALYAVHRFREAGCEPVVAAPSRRRLHLVMHDFEPGWDTYIERPGYGLEADVAFEEVDPAGYDAILLLGGRAPEYLRNNTRLLELVRGFDEAGKWIFAICHGHPDSCGRGARRRKARDLLRARQVGSRTCGRHLCDDTGRSRRQNRDGADLAVTPRVLSRSLRVSRRGGGSAGGGLVGRLRLAVPDLVAPQQ